MNWARMSPCDDCPFLRVGGIRLTQGRVREIAGAVLTHGAGSGFPCHKTVFRGEDEDEGDYDRGRAQQCAGALILADAQGVQTQIVQIVSRLGYYDPRKLRGKGRVFASVDEMLDANRKALGA